MTETPASPDRRALLQQALRAVDEMQARLTKAEASNREPIAIVGLGCRYPGGVDDALSYWKLLRDGVDATSVVPAGRWDVDEYYDPDPNAVGKTISRRGGFLDRVDGFDAPFFGISPREAATLDPQQRLLLEVAWEALEDAGLPPDRLRGSLGGVFVGITTSDYAKVVGVGDTEQTDVYAATGNALNAAAGRLSFVLGLHGPCVSVDTACSSSLTALHLACQSLRNRESDLALAGGVNVVLLPEAGVLFSKWGMLAPDGRCKTFDASADGFVRSEGCGVLALKRLSDAQAAGDRVLALIRGSAVNSDGASSGLTVPNGPAQQMVIRAALARALVSPSDVDYVEAHGTGTPLGDPIEVEALAAVMDPGRAAERPLLIGSVKTNIGHAEAASGVAGVIKVVLALQHEEIPPHLHFKEPNPRIPWPDYRVSVPTKVSPWPRTARRRIAGVSAFGFSGTNAHVVLEEAPLVEERGAGGPDRPIHVIALSAKSDAALAAAAGRLAARLTAHPDTSLPDLAFTTNTGRSPFGHRAAILARSAEEARERLLAAGQEGDTAGVIRGRIVEGKAPRVAFLFTGQGSQYAGMGRQLYDTQPTFRRALDRCAGILAGKLSKPLLDVMFGASGGEGLLDRTGFTQPCLFALEWSLAELWRSWGVEPYAVLGHSVGEFAAAAVAGMLDLEDALGLIAERARLMDSLPGGGEMAAVHASEAEVKAALADGLGDISIAAVNGPESVVISGPGGAVRSALEVLKKRGLKSQALSVSHAFHSPLMEPILEGIDEAARRVRYSEPRAEMVANLTAKVIQPAELAAGYWRRQARNAVRYWDGVQELRRMGCNAFVEIGPGPVLIGLAQRGMDDEGLEWIPSLRKGREDWPVLAEGVARLWVAGAKVDWAGFDRDYPRLKVSVPTYAFQRERHWTEAPARGALAGSSRTRRAASHPFLLSHVRLAHPSDTHVFEGLVSLALFPYLRDHRVQAGVVVPATAYVEMALAAHAQAFGEGPVTLRDIGYRKALFLSADAVHAVQLVLSAGAGGDSAFHIASRPADAPEGTAWTVHASGRIGRETAAPEVPVAPTPEAIRRQFPEEVSGSEFYGLLHDRGNEWGPTFQGVTRLFRGEGEAWSEVSVPAALASQVGRYHFHPAVADASGHVLTATVAMQRTEGARGGAFVGGSIDEVRIYRRPLGLSLWAYARLRPAEDERTNVLVGDVRVFDGAGVVSELRGARLFYLDQETRPARSSVSDWLYDVQWRESPLDTAPKRDSAGPAGTWLVVAAGRLGSAVAERLTARGEHARLVSTQDAPSLEAPALESHRGVVYVREVADSDEAHSAKVGPSRATGVAAAVRLINLMTESTKERPPRLWIVTSGAQPVGEGRLRDNKGASLWGLGRSAALEASEVWGGLIDADPVSPPAEAAALVVEEMLAATSEDQVGFRDGRRFVPRLTRLRVGGGAPTLRSDGAYLVTGGLGGLGLLIARWLVTRGARRLVLMGRTPLGPRSGWADSQGPKAAVIAAVREIEALGASVHLAGVDVGDEAQLAAWIDEYRREGWPPLRGVVHAAGIVRYMSLFEEDEAGLDAVMRAKVDGGRLLDRLLSDAPLDFFVMFSSASALLSSPMYGGYAAGNAFLDALAHVRRAAGRPALSVNWGMWGDVGMVAQFDAAAVAAVAQRGMGSIASDQGLEALDSLLAAGVTHAAVLPVDWDQWRARYPALAEGPFLRDVAFAEARPAAEPRGREDIRAGVLAAPAAERKTRVAAHVAGQVSAVMQVAMANLDTTQPLRELGLDSLMAVEIRNRLDATLGVALSLVSILEGPSVDQLSATVLARLEETSLVAASSGPREPARRSAAELLAELDDLPEAEVDRLLAEMTLESERE
jgi:acyl transferase domain-containing protein/acyl carrier protein